MEEQKVLLSVRGRQTYGDQEPDTIELVTEGTMVFRDGGWDISYEETALTGMEGVTTTFRVEPGKVTLLRTGKLNSTMVFQENVAHDSLYQLEFGALLMTVKATRVFYDLVPDGGMVDLVYEICIENTAGIIDYHLISGKMRNRGEDCSGSPPFARKRHPPASKPVGVIFRYWIITQCPGHSWRRQPSGNRRCLHRRHSCPPCRTPWQRHPGCGKCSP